MCYITQCNDLTDCSQPVCKHYYHHQQQQAAAAAAAADLSRPGPAQHSHARQAALALLHMICQKTCMKGTLHASEGCESMHPQFSRDPRKVPLRNRLGWSWPALEQQVACYSMQSCSIGEDETALAGWPHRQKWNRNRHPQPGLWRGLPLYSRQASLAHSTRDTPIPPRDIPIPSPPNSQQSRTMACKVIVVTLLGLLACAALASAQEAAGKKVSAQTAVRPAEGLQRAWKRIPGSCRPTVQISV